MGDINKTIAKSLNSLNDNVGDIQSVLDEITGDTEETRSVADLLDCLIDVKSDIKDSIEQSGLVWPDTHSTDAGDNFASYASKIDTIVNIGGGHLNLEEKEYYTTGHYEDEIETDSGYNAMSKVIIIDEASRNENADEPEYTGHVDVSGLTAIGWTEEDIEYLESNIWWNEEDDDYWSVSQANKDLYTNAEKVIIEGKEMASQSAWSTFKASTACMYLPKTDLGTLTSLTFGSKYVCAIPKLKVTNTMKSLSSTFSGCGSLRSIDVSEWDTSNVTLMTSTFGNCLNLKKIDVSNWNTSKVTSMASMFTCCEKLEKIDVGNFNTSNVTTITNMFLQCTNITELDVSNWDTSKITSMQKTFQRCYRLVSLDVSNWNVSKVTSFDNTFYYCRRLRKLDVTNWVTTSMTVMQNMFQACISLQLIGIENFNTSKVTNLQYTFNSLQSQHELDLSRWDVSKVTNMTNLFSNCFQLKKLNLNGWDTSNVTNMSSMFSSVTKLKELDLSSFNTSKVTTMANMFYECFNLYTLDISRFDFSKMASTAALPAFTSQGLCSDFDFIKGFLTSAKNSTMTFASPKLQFYSSCSVFDDENGTLQTLFDDCIAAGWTITNLTIVSR